MSLWEARVKPALGEEGPIFPTPSLGAQIPSDRYAVWLSCSHSLEGKNTPDSPGLIAGDVLMQPRLPRLPSALRALQRAVSLMAAGGCRGWMLTQELGMWGRFAGSDLTIQP